VDPAGVAASRPAHRRQGGASQPDLRRDRAPPSGCPALAKGSEAVGNSRQGVGGSMRLIRSGQRRGNQSPLEFVSHAVVRCLRSPFQAAAGRSRLAHQAAMPIRDPAPRARRPRPSGFLRLLRRPGFRLRPGPARRNFIFQWSLAKLLQGGLRPAAKVGPHIRTDFNSRGCAGLSRGTLGGLTRTIPAQGRHLGPAFRCLEAEGWPWSTVLKGMPQLRFDCAAPFSSEKAICQRGLLGQGAPPVDHQSAAFLPPVFGLVVCPRRSSFPGTTGRRLSG